MKTIAIVLAYFIILFAVSYKASALSGPRYRSHSEAHHSADRHTAKQAEKARAQRARAHK